MCDGIGFPLHCRPAFLKSLPKCDGPYNSSWEVARWEEKILNPQFCLPSPQIQPPKTQSEGRQPGQTSICFFLTGLNQPDFHL